MSPIVQMKETLRETCDLRKVSLGVQESQDVKSGLHGDRIPSVPGSPRDLRAGTRVN